MNEKGSGAPAAGSAEERQPIEHELKCWPEPFRLIRIQLKTCEIRKADRDYRIGDTLLQREWNPETERYSDRWVRSTIAHIAKPPCFGLLPEGTWVLSLHVLDRGSTWAGSMERREP